MSERATIKRHPERAVPAEAAEILIRGMVAHVGFCERDQPFVIPLNYGYDLERPDRIYLHGSYDSRTMRHLASGAPVCVTVTTIDGLVYSRTAANHAVNYTSVVCFGRGRTVTDVDQKARLFEAMTRRYFPDRIAGRDYQPASREELERTAVVEVQIEELSAKARRGGPAGPLDADPEAPGTAGVSPA